MPAKPMRKGLDSAGIGGGTLLQGTQARFEWRRVWRAALFQGGEAGFHRRQVGGRRRCRGRAAFEGQQTCFERREIGGHGRAGNRALFQLRQALFQHFHPTGGRRRGRGEQQPTQAAGEND